MNGIRYFEKQDHLRTKFSDVFQRGLTNINTTNPIQALVVLIIITLVPILQIIFNINESPLHFEFVRHQVSIVVSIRAIILTIFLTIIQRRKRIINNCYKRMMLANESMINELEIQIKQRVLKEHLNEYLLYSATYLAMFTLGNIGLGFLISKGDAKYSIKSLQWISTYSIQQFLTMGFFMVCLQIRFKYKKRMVRVVYVTSILWSMLVHLLSSINIVVYEIQLLLIIAMGIIISIELIWWRYRFFSHHQDFMLQEFDQEAQKLKQEAEEKINDILEKLETKGANNINSKAEELLQKLRLLKYQQLIQKNDVIRARLRNKRNGKFKVQPKMTCSLTQKKFYGSNLVQSDIPMKVLPHSQQRFQGFNLVQSDIPIKIISPNQKPSIPDHQIEEFEIDDEDDLGLSIDYDRNESIVLDKQSLVHLKSNNSTPDQINEICEFSSCKVSNKKSRGSVKLDDEQKQIFLRKLPRQLTSQTYQQSISLNMVTPPKSNHAQSVVFQEKHKNQNVMQIVKEDDDVQLNTEDIDDLIKVLTGNKDQIWLPYFLRGSEADHNQMNLSNRRNEEFSPEAKMFILDHFTEREFDFNQFIQDKDQVNEEFVSSPSWAFKQSSNEIARLNEVEDNFNFDFFAICEQGLPHEQLFIDYCTYIFLKFNIHKTLKIGNQKVMHEFFKTMDSSYKDNPYHNCLHAIDVTNSTAFFLVNGLSKVISEFEEACLLISSIAHDLGHPGFNNGFMVSTKSKQALLYNDQSVLENFHASLLFHILQDERSNIVKNLDEVDWKGFRKYCLTLILDTDLQKHFQLLSKFKNYLALGEVDISVEQNRLMVISMAIKCADVGHGAKSLVQHKLWSRRIIEEFFQQGDVESQMGMVVMPMCDRRLSVTKSQEGFLRAIVLPVFEAFNEFLKRLNMIIYNSNLIEVECLAQINSNIQYWQQQQKEEQDDLIISFFKDTDCVLDHVKVKHIKDNATFGSLGNIIFNK